MMKKIFHIIFLGICLSIFLLINADCSIVRLHSLGNTRLAILDEDNNLNLYDYGNNPAFLVYDEPDEWLKFYSNGGYYHSSLRRKYDPEMEQNLSFAFEGLKRLGQQQAIWGRVDYQFDRKFHVFRALEENPYNDPLLLADTTTGNFYNDGPAIQFRYHYQPFRKIGFGAEVNYVISSGIKKQYTRPRTIHRNFELKLAFAWHLHPNLILGGFVNGTFMQNQIELKRSWDGKDIYTLRYRSETVYRLGIGDYDRYINEDGVKLNLALQYFGLNKKLQNLIQFNYLAGNQKIADERGLLREADSPWFKNGFHIQYNNRVLSGRWVFGTELSFEQVEEWNEHPLLPILITENSLKVIKGGMGLSHQFSRILFVAEGRFRRSWLDYDDYQANIHQKRKTNTYEMKIGLEYQLNNLYSLQFGLESSYFRAPLVFYRILPDHSIQGISLGVIKSNSNYEIEANFGYVIKNATYTSAKYDGWNFLIFTRIFVD